MLYRAIKNSFSLSKENRDNYLPHLDSVRFISIVWILYFHIYGSTPGRGSTIYTNVLEEFIVDVFASGHFGVQLFFVIGGFFIGRRFAIQHLYQGGKQSLGHFYMSRFGRIHPPYVINILLISLMFIVTHNTGWVWPLELTAKVDPIPFMLRHNLASLMYVHNLAAGYSNPLNTVLWFMETQVQFYLLSPLLAYVFMISSAKIRRGVLMLLIFCWPSIVQELPDWLCFGFVQQCHWFLLGFLWVDLHLANYPYLKFEPIVWDIIGIVGWIILLSQAHRISQNWAVHLLPIIVFISFVSVLKGRFLSKFFVTKWTSMLGSISYTIYLYHYLVLLIFGRIIQASLGLDSSFGSLVVLVFSITPIVLMVSIPLYLLFERPFATAAGHPRNRYNVRTTSATPN